MRKTIIHTDEAPAAIGPYSQAVRVGTLLFTSGQIGLDPSTGEMPADPALQARQGFANLRAILQAAGASTKDVVKLTIFLTDMNDFAAVNEEMKRVFEPPYPARSCVAVAALPKGAAFEAEAVAAVPESDGR